MTANLLRQDAAVRALPRWLAVSAGVAVTLLGLVVYVTTHLRIEHGIESSELASVSFYGLVMWLTLGVFLFTPAFRTRCSPLAMTLPVPAKRLWVTHLVAVVLVGVAVLGVMTLVAMSSLWTVERLDDRAPEIGRTTLVRLALALVVTNAFVATLLHAHQPHNRQIRRDRRFKWRATGALVGGWALVTFLALASPLLLAVPVVATIVLGVRAQRTVPRAFALLVEVSPRVSPEEDPSRRAGLERTHSTRVAAWSLERRSDRGARRRGAGVRLVAHALYRASPKSRSLALFGIPGLLFVGLLLAGVFDAFDDDGSAAFRWISVPITTYMLVAIFAKPLKSIALFDPLPVSRRHLFALSIVPSLLLLCIGYGAGQVVVGLVGPKRGVDFTVMSSSCSGISVPHSLLRIAWNGDPPALETPWGERHQAWQVQLWKGSPAVLYSPYCSRDTAASLDFIAQRTSLATEALYGARVSASQIRERYLDSGATQLTFRPDDSKLHIRHAWTAFPLLMVFVCCSWFLCVAIYMSTFRPGVGDAVCKRTLIGMLVALMALHIAQFVPFILDVTEPWIVGAFWQIVIRAFVENVPGGTATLWVLAAALIAAFYWAAERRFARAEFQVAAVPTLC